MLKHYIVILFAAIILTGCSAHTNIEPVGEGNTNLNVSVGGPIIKAFDMKFPLPYFTIGAVHGMSENVNVSANIHLTSLPYKIFACDLGASYFAVKNKGYVPEIGIHPVLLVLASFKNGVNDRARAYPSISSTFAWHYGKNIIFTGFDFTLPVTKPDYNDEASNYIISPFVGYKMELGKNYRLVTEVKWQAANIRTDQLAAEYVNYSGKGALGLLFSFERSF